MTGLDNIIDEILTEARREADDILAGARSESDAIKAQALEQAAAQVKEIEAETSKRILELNRGRETALELRRRQAVLEARQTALNETLSAARQELNGLPDSEYFTLISKLAAAQAQTGKGMLLFNARDKARLPKNFQHLLKAALPKDKILAVSETPAQIDGGFIIKYGDVEENCSFAAVFRERRDEFIDLIRGLLFAR